MAQGPWGLEHSPDTCCPPSAVCQPASGAGNLISDKLSNSRGSMTIVPSKGQGHGGFEQRKAHSFFGPSVLPISMAPWPTQPSPPPSPPSPKGNGTFFEFLRAHTNPDSLPLPPSFGEWGGWGSEKPGHLTLWVLDCFRLVCQPPLWASSVRSSTSQKSD